jgi:hypothetical protein
MSVHLEKLRLTDVQLLQKCIANYRNRLFRHRIPNRVLLDSMLCNLNPVHILTVSYYFILM